MRHLRNGVVTDRSYEYPEVHQLIFNWIEDGLLKFEGNRSYSAFTDLDHFILKSLGYKCTKHDTYKVINDLDLAVRDGKINVDWLFGPHGLALYKALLIRRGMR
jgi:hypothetical protein